MQFKQVLSASTLIRDSYIDIQGIAAYGWILRDSVVPLRIHPQGIAVIALWTLKLVFFSEFRLYRDS